MDVYPTLADLCGLEIPKTVEGKSLRPLLKNPDAKWTKPAITQQNRTFEGHTLMGYSVRTERWRYTEWGRGKFGVELYDHNNDPHEWHNLASDPKFAKQIAELKALLPPSAENLPAAKKKKKG